MAELRVEGSDLVLHLTTAEHIEGVHGDLRVPLRSVRAAEVLEDAHASVGPSAGMKVGTRLPGVVEVATIYGPRKIFAAVHRDAPRGVRILLEGASYDEWVVGCSDPEGVIGTLSLSR
ncbi:MAG TPA: hypothetical protein VFN50_02895 [Acidimicrobiales bacterium]|nr:hypothetical protein [Acidimicrobiales bacterium]